MVIRSYRRVFRLDRRIYAFGDWQLPLPNGIPLRGLVYFIAALLLSLIVWKLPVIGLFFGILPWPVRHVILPLWIAAAGMTFSPDGRRADLFVWTWLSLMGRRVRARVQRESMDWSGKLRVRWDSSDVVLHRALVKGPAAVAFVEPVRDVDKWHGWCAVPDADGRREITVRADQSLKVWP